MQKHIPNINPSIHIVGLEPVAVTGQRTEYCVNRLGEQVSETAPDGSIIVRRPVASRLIINFDELNDEALLAIVADRLADRSAGEYGSRRIDAAAKQVQRALAAIRADSTKPLRKRPQGEQAGEGDGEAEAEPAADAPKSQIPGVTV